MPISDPDLVEVEEEEQFECPSCGSSFQDEDDALDCCAYHCPECGSSHRDEDDAEACCAHLRCPNCGASHYDETEALDCCTYQCYDCGSRYDYPEDAESCCGSSFHGSLPYLGEVEPHPMVIPSIPGRPARYCSLEQELSEGGPEVAALLYEKGLSRDRSMLGYHSSSGGAGTIHVEQDGSLGSGGGEVVYDRFDLAREQDADRMGLALASIRALRDHNPGNRIVRTGFDAGIHVHVSARDMNGECITPTMMAALHEVWSYAEDMLYSLSAAGWNRHRQPIDRHRGGYCKAVPKVAGLATPAKVWRAMRADRYYGLNLQRLFNATVRCSCGAAGMGDWDECDCGAMASATIEFRVFNTSTLPRTIKAFITISLAMVAYATRHEIGTLPENEYGSQSPAEKREVLNHLLDILPLLEEERELILEVANRAPGL